MTSLFSLANKLRLAGAAVVAAGAAASLFLWPAQSSDLLLKPNDPQAVAVGAQIYAEQCAACHGENLEGQQNWRQREPDGRMRAPPHDATGHTWHHPENQLFDLTKFGLAKMSGLEGFKTDMPVYAEILDDAEIIAVLSFIKSRWPTEIRQRHDEMSRMSAQ